MATWHAATSSEAFAAAEVEVEGEFETGFIEHAYIEPEAGYAERVGDRVEVQVTTQSPHMDRIELEAILGLPDGGGPHQADGGRRRVRQQARPVGPALSGHRRVEARPSRAPDLHAPRVDDVDHQAAPSRLRVRIGATGDGGSPRWTSPGEFNTGAYASWGPTVANRVPVHASGPYVYDAYRARTVAVHTNGPPSGAFRGFGVPQSTIATGGLFDELADAVGVDRLEFRYRNALTAGVPTVTGQVFDSGVGLPRVPRGAAARTGSAPGPTRPPRTMAAAGPAAAWASPACGTGAATRRMAEPVDDQGRACVATGRVALFQGAVDMGQGANTVMTQICADALGIDMSRIVTLGADTDTTPDAGKSSASRQTFISGNATFLAGTSLRARLLRSRAPPTRRTWSSTTTTWSCTIAGEATGRRPGGTRRRRRTSSWP